MRKSPYSNYNEDKMFADKLSIVLKTTHVDDISFGDSYNILNPE